ncbi:MAG: restriction endonuclease [Chloroflexota bacterium]|nr:restriction endonuclease [Chloroflexota bacterium]
MAQEELAQRALTEDKEDRDDMMNLATSEVAEASLAQIDVNDLVADLTGWRETLADLLEQMPREAFERLFLRLLGEDGMGEIELIGANDVIEGMGTVGGGGFFSFRVSFKCIRGGGRISSGEIDDFRREVMVGRADRGLLITTGKFTQEAELKAASDRAPEIRLIDGDEFIDKLKELKLGLVTERVVVERVVIDEAWFAGV